MKPYNNFITFMWFRTFGEMKTLKLKVKTLKGIIIFSSIFALLGIFFFFTSIFLFYSNRYLRVKAYELEKGIINTKAIYIKQTNKNNIGTKSIIEGKADGSNEDLGRINIPKDIEVDQVADALIEISNVQKLISSDFITISFQLKNVKSGAGDSISGYVILIGKNDDIANPIFSTYPPKVQLNNIFPSDYRQGERFYIKNLKNVKGNIRLTYGDSSINEIIIYVFSAVGELLLEKSIPIGGNYNDF